MKAFVESAGDISRFSAKVVKEVWGGRVFKFFGEALRQAGILIVGSTLVIWGLCFILGLQCGIEGAYFSRSVGAPAQAGVFSAWCDLREIMPYAFGYMMSAKVGTGLVAEIGAMRISDEIDALEVMGISSMTFLCATRLLAAWIVLPFMYIAGIGAGFFASYLAVVQQIGEVSSGGFFLIFWMFQNPPDLLYSLIKGMAMATVIVLVGCYYGYTASGGPVGVGTATAKSMVLNTVMVHVVGMLGTQIFWGTNPRAPIGGSLLHIAPSPPRGPSLPVEVDERPARAALRDQIARLEDQLASHVTTAFPLSPSPALIGGTSGATLLTLAQLESRRDALATRVADVRRALDALGKQQELARGRLEQIMLDPAAHPWERVTNADIGEPGCRQVHARPRFGILGAMLDWWRVRISSGCPLCMARSRRSP